MRLADNWDRELETESNPLSNSNASSFIRFARIDLSPFYKTKIRSTPFPHFSDEIHKIYVFFKKKGQITES